VKNKRAGMKIKHIMAREIFDSRGWPTVQCEIVLDNGQSVSASVPSGKSVGSYEALEIRDGGTRLLGRGVLKAVENIEQVLGPQFIGLEPNGIEMDLKIIEIDGSSDKSRLGANATLALSMALYKAEALADGIELYELMAYFMGADSVRLPFPMINIINGGVHANNNLSIQEFMIVPVGAASFRAAFEAGVMVYYELGEILKSQGKSIAVGDEGGYASYFDSDIEALEVLTQAIEQSNKRHSSSCIIALDVAANQIYDATTKLYKLGTEFLTADELIDFYQELVDKYPIFSIEDGLAESDWENWQKMTKRLAGKIQIVGDDIFATNIYRVAQGIIDEVASSVIIKPNQAGTVTEALQAIKLCKARNINTIGSHRSGETEDTFIADLAVGASLGQIKAGACCRSERLAKYNRLLAIEDALSLALWNA
jgi:enolase